MNPGQGGEAWVVAVAPCGDPCPRLGGGSGRRTSCHARGSPAAWAWCVLQRTGSPDAANHQPDVLVLRPAQPPLGMTTGLNLLLSFTCPIPSPRIQYKLLKKFIIRRGFNFMPKPVLIGLAGIRVAHGSIIYYTNFYHNQ